MAPLLLFACFHSESWERVRSLRSLLSTTAFVTLVIVLLLNSAWNGEHSVVSHRALHLWDSRCTLVKVGKTGLTLQIEAYLTFLLWIFKLLPSLWKITSDLVRARMRCSYRHACIAKIQDCVGEWEKRPSQQLVNFQSKELLKSMSSWLWVLWAAKTSSRKKDFYQNSLLCGLWFKHRYFFRSQSISFGSENMFVEGLILPIRSKIAFCFPGKISESRIVFFYFLHLNLDWATTSEYAFLLFVFKHVSSRAVLPWLSAMQNYFVNLPGVRSWVKFD